MKNERSHTTSFNDRPSEYVLEPNVIPSK